MPTAGDIGEVIGDALDDAFEETDRGDRVPLLKSRAIFAIDLAGDAFSSDDKAKLASAINTTLGATSIEITSATLTKSSARLRRTEESLSLTVAAAAGASGGERVLLATGTARSLAKSNADVAFVAKFDGVGALKNAQSRIAHGAEELASDVPLFYYGIQLLRTRVCGLVETDCIFDCTRHCAIATQATTLTTELMTKGFVGVKVETIEDLGLKLSSGGSMMLENTNTTTTASPTATPPQDADDGGGNVAAIAAAVAAVCVIAAIIGAFIFIRMKKNNRNKRLSKVPFFKRKHLSNPTELPTLRTGTEMKHLSNPMYKGELATPYRNKRQSKVPFFNDIDPTRTGTEMKHLSNSMYKGELATPYPSAKRSGDPMPVPPPMPSRTAKP